jgi:tetratricopeptide (TPR) repeat protein
LEDLTQHYLNHPEEREAIASRGREEVLHRHTYAHRVREVLERVDDLTRSGDFRSARPEVKRREGNTFGSSHETARQLELNGCLDQARDLYLERVKADPLDATALIGLSRVSVQMEEWEEAESYLDRAVAASPQWEALFLLARCKMKLGKLAEALAHLETAETHDGQDTSRQTRERNLMGDCLTRMGQHDRAENKYRQALASDDRSADAWTGLGVLGTLKEDYGNAQRAFGKAIRIDAKNDRALCGLGVSQWNGGKKEEAYENLKKSLDSNPENLTSLNHLLRCSWERNDLPIAEGYLKRYLEFHPLNPHVLFSLAGLYYHLGRHDEARPLLETILMFEPNHEEARQLTTLISGDGLDLEHREEAGKQTQANQESSVTT